MKSFGESKSEKSTEYKNRNQEDKNMDANSRKGRSNTVRRPPEANTPAFSGATTSPGPQLSRAFSSLEITEEPNSGMDVPRSQSMDRENNSISDLNRSSKGSNWMGAGQYEKLEVKRKDDSVPSMDHDPRGSSTANNLNKFSSYNNHRNGHGLHTIQSSESLGEGVGFGPTKTDPQKRDQPAPKSRPPPSSYNMGRGTSKPTMSYSLQNRAFAKSGNKVGGGVPPGPTGGGIGNLGRNKSLSLGSIAKLVKERGGIAAPTTPTPVPIQEEPPKQFNSERSIKTMSSERSGGQQHDNNHMGTYGNKRLSAIESDEATPDASNRGSNVSGSSNEITRSPNFSSENVTGSLAAVHESSPGNQASGRYFSHIEEENTLDVQREETGYVSRKSEEPDQFDMMTKSLKSEPTDLSKGDGQKLTYFTENSLGEENKSHRSTRGGASSPKNQERSHGKPTHDFFIRTGRESHKDDATEVQSSRRSHASIKTDPSPVQGQGTPLGFGLLKADQHRRASRKREEEERQRGKSLSSNQSKPPPTPTPDTPPKMAPSLPPPMVSKPSAHGAGRVSMGLQKLRQVTAMSMSFQKFGQNLNRGRNYHATAQRIKTDGLGHGENDHLARTKSGKDGDHTPSFFETAAKAAQIGKTATSGTDKKEHHLRGSVYNRPLSGGDHRISNVNSQRQSVVTSISHISHVPESEAPPVRSASGDSHNFALGSSIPSLVNGKYTSNVTQDGNSSDEHSPTTPPRKKISGARANKHDDTDSDRILHRSGSFLDPNNNSLNNVSRTSARKLDGVEVKKRLSNTTPIKKNKGSSFNTESRRPTLSSIPEQNGSPTGFECEISQRNSIINSITRPLDQEIDTISSFLMSEPENYLASNKSHGGTILNDDATLTSNRDNNRPVQSSDNHKKDEPTHLLHLSSPSFQGPSATGSSFGGPLHNHSKSSFDTHFTLGHAHGDVSNGLIQNPLAASSSWDPAQRYSGTDQSIDKKRNGSISKRTIGAVGSFVQSEPNDDTPRTEGESPRYNVKNVPVYHSTATPVSVGSKNNRKFSEHNDYNSIYTANSRKQRPLLSDQESNSSSVPGALEISTSDSGLDSSSSSSYNRRDSRTRYDYLKTNKDIGYPGIRQDSNDDPNRSRRSERFHMSLDDVNSMHSPPNSLGRSGRRTNFTGLSSGGHSNQYSTPLDKKTDVRRESVQIVHRHIDIISITITNSLGQQSTVKKRKRVSLIGRNQVSTLQGIMAQQNRCYIPEVKIIHKDGETACNSDDVVPHEVHVVISPETNDESTWTENVFAHAMEEDEHGLDRLLGEMWQMYAQHPHMVFTLIGDAVVQYIERGEQGQPLKTNVVGLILAVALKEEKQAQEMIRRELGDDMSDDYGAFEQEWFSIVRLCTNSRNDTALQLASRLGYTDIVKLLLHEGWVPSCRDRDGLTPLIITSKTGNLEIASELINFDADINQADTEGLTPLMYSIIYSNIPMFHFLLSVPDLDPNIESYGIVDSMHRVPIQLILSNKDLSSEERFDMVTALINNGVDVKKWPLLPRAASLGSVDICRSLIAAQAEVNAPGLDGATSLIRAARSGNTAIVHLLLTKHADVDKPNGLGETPLFWAARLGHKHIVRLLISSEADVNGVDGVGKTALHRASESNYPPIVRQLIELGAFIYKPDLCGHTPLFTAVCRGYLEVCDSLLKAKATTCHRDDAGDPLLFIYKATIGGHREIVRMLVKHRGNVNEFDIVTGDSPLIVAAKTNSLDIADVLIRAQANINQVNNAVEAPLLLASRNGHTKMIKLLLKSKADANLSSRSNLSSIYWASMNGHYHAVKTLIKARATVGQPSISNRTPLFWACIQGHSKIVDLLVKHSPRTLSPLKNAEQQEKLKKQASCSSFNIGKTSSIVSIDGNAGCTNLMEHRLHGEMSISKSIPGRGVTHASLAPPSSPSQRRSLWDSNTIGTNERPRFSSISDITKKSNYINVSAELDDDPIYWSCILGHEAIVKTLVTAGVVEVKKDHLRAAQQSGNIFIESLIESKLNNRRGRRFPTENPTGVGRNRAEAYQYF